ncbi:hypothetical protein [Mucilaginibacter paludis]|uniref:Uncharacterized protein n=1 Tax=Mucilaginibacter paludis DSM 18603 TaxID=714943 RepID=H1YC54_9SPHI|nr:hypothetical protein [Mucilaginibacter paludis]EHQ29617.1 hypothetical protein Mucpa_5546 [Mucilaginibacter paludis DSM 18603]
MKTKLSNNSFFRTHKSFSAEEIMAAGGAMAFGIKSGKDNYKLIEALKAVPPIEPFSDDEWAQILRQLKDSKY